MLNSGSFSQLGPNAPRAPSQASKSRHLRGPSQGRRPKAERVISMSRNASHKSDVIEGPSTAAPHWTKNEKYCVTRLPARPSKVDNTAQFPRIYGTTSGESSYALISTPESVYVWSYVTHHSDPMVLTFPVRSKDPSLATLVSPNAGSHEPGLILVKPVTGQIAYWDAVGSAVAEGLIQRGGVQTILPLNTGETLTYLCNAEPAGFVIATSKCALWNISVRDSEGRPHLSFVGMTNTGGAWLSGLRSFIGTGQGRTDIVAVKPGVRDTNSERRGVFVATKRGAIEKWELARGGVYRLVGHGDIHLSMVEILRRQGIDDSMIAIEDIASVPVAQGSSDKLVVLASCISQNSIAYSIFLCLLPEGQPPRILSGTLLPPPPLEYSSLRPGASFQPQIFVPSPGRSAFIAYSRGFSIISLPDGSDDWPYCDTVTFRDDFAQLRVIAAGQEDLSIDRASNRKLRNPGMVLVIQGAGVVRCETFDTELGDSRLLTTGTEWIQSKIEQAVFYGVSSENPLDFKPRREWNWKLVDVEQVVIKISTEILVSKYTQLGLPLEESLVSKCRALVALAQYIKTFFPEVSYATRQTLLLDAEKADAARQLWGTWGKRLEILDTHERATQILETVVKDMHREVTGEAVYVDVVREWFRNEPSKIGDLIVRTLRVCQKYVRSQYGKDPIILARAILETNEISLYSLAAAHEFRNKHQDLYSVDAPNNGLKLPSALAPWTSSPDVITSLTPQYDATLSVLGDFHVSVPSEADPQAPKTRQQTENMEREDMRLALEETLASLAEMLCKIYVERVTWCRALIEDDQEKVRAEEIWKQYLVKRGDWIKPLATFGRSDKALDIAEIYRDYKTLVELCLEPRDEDVNRHQRIHERLEYYLMHYGEDFAFTLYNFYLQNQMYAELLQEFPREKASLSKFLQPQKYEKLRWIHELSFNRYQDAGHTLQEIASHERRLRHKKLSLSIAKLSLLVVTPPNATSQGAESIDIGLAAVNAQLQFAEETIKPVVENCIDNQARVEIALEHVYLARNLKKSHLRTRIVKRALEYLVEDRVVDTENLIDLFTLKKRGQGSSAETAFETYFWALQVLRAADLPEPRKQLALKLIWLRAYLQDDWPKIEGYVLAMPEDEVEAAWRATAIYQIIRNAMNFQVMGSTISPFRPLQPSEALLPDRTTLLAVCTPRLSGWAEADVDRYLNELLAESEMLRKWAGKLEGDESRLLGSLQSLAKKDLDASRGLDKVKENQLVVHSMNGMGHDATGADGSNEDVEMIY